MTIEEYWRIALARRIHWAKYTLDEIGEIAIIADRYGNIRLLRKARRATMRPSEFIAKVGAKVEVVGTVITAQNILTDFGTRRQLVVRTDEGDKVGTFGSGASFFTCDKGDRVTIKGTVKELKDDPKWGKETRLTRCKVAVLEAAA